MPSQLLPGGEIGGGRVNLAHENSSDEDSVEDEVNEKEAIIQAEQVTRRKSSGNGRQAPTSSHISSTQSLQQVPFGTFGMSNTSILSKKLINVLTKSYFISGN